jgi:hypothetical protein
MRAEWPKTGEAKGSGINCEAAIIEGSVRSAARKMMNPLSAHNFFLHFSQHPRAPALRASLLVAQERSAPGEIEGRCARPRNVACQSAS